MRHFEYFCALFVVVFLTYGGIPFVCKDGKNIKYNQDQSSIMLLNSRA